VKRLSVLSLLSLSAVAAVSLSLLPAGPAAAQPTATAPAPAAAQPEPLIGPPTPGGLTAEQVARRTAATSYDVRARSEERAAADAAVSEASASFVPRLSGVARYTRLSKVAQAELGNVVAVPAGTPPGPVPAGTQLLAFPLTFPTIDDQYSASARLQVPLSDYIYRLPKLRSSAKDNARAARMLEQATALRVATDGRVAYYGWASTRLQAEVARRALVSAEAHLKDVRTAHQTGAASKADVLSVESQVASAQLQVTRAESAVANAEQRLRTLMHDTGTGGYEIGEDLRGAPSESTLAATLSKPAPELVKQAIERRLESRAMMETAKATRSQASAVRATEFPRLDGVANANYDRPNQRIFPQTDEFRGSWDAGVQLSWSPTDIFGSEATHSRILANARQIDAERASLNDNIELEVIQAVLAVREADAAMVTTERGLVAAEESYRVRRALFQNGRATSVELSDAETERSRAQQEAIGARIDRRIAEARLIHALGNDVR
jgi:outer membrane protein TolC